MEKFIQIIRNNGLFIKTDNLNEKFGTKSIVDLHRLYYGKELFESDYRNVNEETYESKHGHIDVGFEEILDNIITTLSHINNIDLDSQQFLTDLRDFKLNISSELLSLINFERYDCSYIYDSCFKFIIQYSYLGMSLDKKIADTKFIGLINNIVEVILHGGLPCGSVNNKILFYYKNEVIPKVDIPQKLLEFIKHFDLFVESCSLDIHNKYKFTSSTTNLIRLTSGKKFREVTIKSDIKKDDLIINNREEVLISELLNSVILTLNEVNKGFSKGGDLEPLYRSIIQLLLPNVCKNNVRQFIDILGLKKIEKIKSIGNFTYNLQLSIMCVFSYLFVDDSNCNKEYILSERIFCEDLIKILQAGYYPLGWTGDNVSNGEFIIFNPDELLKLLSV